MRPTIEIQVMGGLGNQLHGLAAGWAIAGYHESNMLVNAVRVPFGSNVTRRYELGSLDLNFGSKNISVINQRPKVFHNIRERVLRKLRFTSREELRSLKVDYWDSKEGVQFQLEATPAEGKICGEFLDFEWADLAKSYGFPTKIQILNQRSALQKTIDEIDESDIAVHVRLGDYLLHEDIFSSIPEEYYLEALKRCNYVNARSIILFSDSPRLVADRYPNLCRIVKRIEDAKWSSIETMKIIASYRTIISANSTFSTWAGWFAHQQGSQVFTPIPHLKNNWIDKMPKEWNRYSITDGNFL